VAKVSRDVETVTFLSNAWRGFSEYLIPTSMGLCTDLISMFWSVDWGRNV